MANTKNYSIRERVLDHYLGSGQWYSRAQLEEFCNRALEARGETPITSRTTLQNDFLNMENTYFAVIEKKKVGRVTYYKYRDAGFSIFKNDLSDEDYHHLREAMDVLSKFRGMPQFEWVDEMDARFNANFINNGEGKSIVGFEDNSYNRGMEHFSPIFNAIKERITIDITYKSFKMKEAKVYSISPYYLKQYNNRWFLFGSNIGYQSIGVYPLDRIEKIANAGKKYEPCEVDFDDYFEDVVGVSKPNEESEKVEIWFSKEQLSYVETKPIHGSQRIIERDDQGGIIQLDVIINYELEQLILSYGEKARVLYPEDFREKIKRRIEESLKNY